VATLRGHLVDADPQDELFLRVDWGDGTPTETHAVGRALFALQHRYLDDAPSSTAADDYQVHLTWFDSGGGSNSKTLPVTVNNVVPRVSVGLPASLLAGEALARTGSFADPGLDSWYANVDYGDGRGPEWLPLGPDGTFTLNHRYTRPGAYQVRVRVFDDDTGVGTATLDVTVRNAPPHLVLGGAEVVRVGEVMRHTGTLTGPDSNTWRATVDYGDGDGPQPLAVRPGQQLSFEHRYTKPGRYRVTVTVLDDDDALATDSFLVIVL
ncbi:MAG TPA: PKD domain-containing protein, partial [Gemmataceae bacterium]|nr:PKD domain-containing protein [Gemmataceae bacterium]